jgi:hypothetical protein
MLFKELLSIYIIMETVKISKNSNSPEYIKNYMKDYIKKQSSVECDICGGKYKPYQKYLHDNKVKRHIMMSNLLNKKNDVIKV